MARLVILLSVLCVAFGGLESWFMQDVAYRSIFIDELDSEQPLPLPVTAWEHLPFPALQSKHSLLALPSLGCSVALSQGKLYSTTRNQQQTLDDKLNLVSPFGPWKQIADLGVDASSTMIGETSPIFVVTGDDVVAVSLSGACDMVTAVQDRLLLDSTAAKWGSSVSSLSLASKSKILYVCSENEGLFAVSLDSGNVEQIQELGSACTSALYVEEQSALYAANSIALYTYPFTNDGKRSSSAAHHEWIGGNIDYAPIDMVYDAANNYVWIAQTEAIHRFEASSGALMRFGYQQNSPFRNVSSVAISGGSVWVSSSSMGVSRLPSTSNPVQLDGLLVPPVEPGELRQSDPWVWSYYGGHRYLPSNQVLGVVTYPGGANSLDEEESVFVVTTVGLAFLHRTKWTLKEKTNAEMRLQPRHDRHGLSSGIVFGQPGDYNTYKQTVDDNDGLWTSMHVMGMAYWALTEPDNTEAVEHTWRGFTGLEKLNILPGAYPKYPARTFCRVGDEAAILEKNGNVSPQGCGSDLTDPVWHPAVVTNASELDAGKYFYKGDTSSDELCGHMAAYPLVYDAAARTPDQQRRVLNLFEGILVGIIENDYNLMDPATGQPTTWGFWSPEQLNGNIEHYSERGPNSLQLLAWCAAGYSLTGKSIYSETFWTMVLKHNYARNAINVKFDSTVDENHSDTELIMLAYHALFYARERLSQSDAKRAELDRMCELLLPSLRRTWLLARGEMSPLWMSIYAGTAGQKVTIEEAQSAEWSLRRWAIDNIDWQVSGTGRLDLVMSPFNVRNGQVPLFKNSRPPAERAASHANTDPFESVAGSVGSYEVEPAVFTTPAWMMAYYGLLKL